MIVVDRPFCFKCDCASEWFRAVVYLNMTRFGVH